MGVFFFFFFFFGLKSPKNWQEVLSLGEQQRLAMARLFHHKPTFAILDECSSAVSMEMEDLLYRECQQLGITFVDPTDKAEGRREGKRQER
jgi:ABC-type uncharacterized transport system fused permease/ATPase subunit